MRVVSTYTGAGGLDVGFHEAGAEILAACEIDKTACETFAANFPKVPIYNGTVRSALNETFFARGADVLIGGPPCQGFSVAGKMDPADPRSTEIFTFFNVLRRVQPKAFVMENVKALAALKKWEFVRSRIFSEANSSGYQVMLVLLNSADYGVPQRRERAFFIGLSTIHFDAADVQAVMTRLNAAINDAKVAPIPIRDVLTSFGPAGSQGNSRVCNAKINFARNPILRKSPYAGMLFNGAGRPIPLHGPSNTLPASMGGNKTPIIDEDELHNGGNSFIEQYHRHLLEGGTPRSGQAPKRLRRLTVDECIAIQSFPARHRFRGSQSSIYKQIGNAVPPKLAQIVATSLKSALKSLDETSSRTRTAASA